MSAVAETAAPALGSLRDRVQLKRRDTSPEDEGGEVTTFVPLATVWGRVTVLSSRRAQSGDSRTSSINYSVVIRYRTDLQPGDRIVYAGRNLEIVSATDLNGRRSYTACTCIETSVTG